MGADTPNDIPGRTTLWLCWLIAPLPLFLPLLVFNPVTMWGNSDALFYVNILAMLSDTLRSGNIDPHWLAQANSGFGSPVMLFYAPLSYILTAIINLPLSFLHLRIEMQFLVGIYASQVVSGVTAFLWLKRSFPRHIAFAGSLLFVLLPYKLVYIYGHINLAQLWALAFLPLWMLAAERLAAGSLRAVGLYALAFAAVYCCHPLTVIAFGAIPAGYVLWFGRGRGWPVVYFRLTLVHALALGICLVKALPQHYDLPWIHLEDFLEGRLNWKNNLLHIDVVLCTYYGLMALIGIEMRQNPTLKTTMHARVAGLWLIVMGVVIFLCEPVSALVWKYVRLLQYLQFPSARLHACVLMGVIYLTCCWLLYYDTFLPKARLAYSKSALAFVMGVYAIFTLVYLHNVNAKPNDLTADYIRDMHEAHIIPSPEYRTHWNCIGVPAAYRMYTQHSAPADIALASGNADISNITWQPPGLIAFTAGVASAKAEISIRQCYFPLWQARDEAGREVPLTPQGDNGLTGLSLPQGNHRITLRFMESSEEPVTRRISYFAALVSFAYLISRRSPSKQKE